MGERILVTGASGFVGRQIVAALAASGAEVHGVARALPSEAVGAVTWHQADLLADAGAAIIARLRPQILVHAAWYVAHGRFWNAPENGEWVQASIALARHFAAAGGRRFVGLGTCAEYANEPVGDGPYAEHRALAPTTPYGLAKAEAAAAIAAVPGLSTAWARLFFLFGPYEHPDRLVPSVCRAILAGRDAACASGRPVRDFCSTAYAGQAIATLAQTEVVGPVNIGSGDAISIADLVRRIGAMAGRPDLIALGRLPDRDNEPPMIVADTTRLRAEAGFRRAFELDAALSDALSWWRERGRDCARSE